jgi:protocatechuate 3,4-dioxygenase beta subunit
MVTTDGEGRYEFTDLPAGVFTVSVAKPGFLTLQYGQRRPFETGRPVTLAAAQALGQIDVALPRASVISGRVTDRRGEPAIGAEILIERYQYSSDGQRRLIRLAASTTDDLGEFRAFGLMPGEYIVSANLRARPSFAAAVGQATADAPLAGYLQTYNPGTPNVVDAEPVLLGLGEEASVQIALSTGRMSTITGTIIDSLGRPAAGANLMLLITEGSSRSGRGSGSAAADGTFSIPNVPPGEHFVQVRLPPRPERPGVPENANVPVAVVNANVSGLQIVTGPPATVSGTVQWEGTTPRTTGAAASPLRMKVSPADGRPALLGLIGVQDAAADGRVGSDNTFRLTGALGKVRLEVDGVPPGWTVKSIMAGTADLLTTGADVANLDGNTRVRVVLTDKVTELTGSVRSPSGAPATEFVVVVLPSERVDSEIAARYVQVLRPDQRGAFRARGLPPGQYVAAAMPSLEEGAHWDPAFQATVRSAATTRRVTLSEGQAVTLTLDLMP